MMETTVDLRALVETAGDAIIVADVAGRIGEGDALPAHGNGQGMAQLAVKHMGGRRGHGKEQGRKGKPQSMQAPWRHTCFFLASP